MRATFFQAIKLLFGLLGFVGILVGYRGSDYPLQANPTPMFLATPRAVITPHETTSVAIPEQLKSELRQSLQTR